MHNGKLVLCEVGVGPPSMAYAHLVWNDPNVEVLAFEPHPEYYAAVSEAAGLRPNVTIHNVAIGDENGQMDLITEGTSSSLVGVASPFAQHYRKPDAEKPKVKVEVRRISEYDHGQIDILRVDTEGSEWWTLKHLVSRPRQIVVETHNDLATYINPYLYEIMEWATQNGYRLISVAAGDHTFERP